VYHHHGLHQGNTPERAKGVVSIIERVDADVVNDLPDSLRPENSNIVAVVPVQGEIQPGTLKYRLLTQTLAAVKAAKYVKKTYLVADRCSFAAEFGANWLDRKQLPNANSKGLDELMQSVLVRIEMLNDFPSGLLYVNYDYPFRPKGLFDRLILDAQHKGYDTVFPGLIDFGHYWFRSSGGEFKQTDPSVKSRVQRDPIYRALFGLGCVSATWVIRSGKMVDGKIGILPIQDPLCATRVREEGSERVFEALLKYDPAWVSSY
jgi:rhamnosyltransferase